MDEIEMKRIVKEAVSEEVWGEESSLLSDLLWTLFVVVAILSPGVFEKILG